MAIVTPAEGEAVILNRMLGKSATADLTLRLYENDYTPVDGSTYANFTTATFPGYAADVLENASWTVSDVAGTETASYPEVTFTASGSGTSVYGYYVTVGTSTVVFAERFSDGPYTIANSGDTVNVTLSFTLD